MLYQIEKYNIPEFLKLNKLLKRKPPRRNQSTIIHKDLTIVIWTIPLPKTLRISSNGSILLS